MSSSVWSKVLESCADPERARHYYEQFRQTSAKPELRRLQTAQAKILAALFSGSQPLSEWLIAQPDWFREILDPEWLSSPRPEQRVRREVRQWLEPLLEAKDYPSAYSRLREFKQREMLRIGARDLAGLGGVPEIIRELSQVADICLETVYQLCHRRLTDQYGHPYHRDPEDQWTPTQFCILGMGKLGGQELNYSSDVDLLFVYSDEGQLFKETPRPRQTGTKGMANHQFFKRLAENFINEVSRLTPEGALYRIDMRLRPEGESGPLARSLPSYENYYAQWGQTWERMMLIKARWVAGDKELAGEFMETIHPFRYPRSLGDRVLHDIARMKNRIEEEVVKSGELDRNVKLGRGGIREIEFVVQTLQLVEAGRIPFLQNSQTLPALEKLVQYRFLSEAESQVLRETYCFLRGVEHRLQMENNRQTHTIPADPPAQERLARLMGFTSVEAFQSTRQQQTEQVRKIYHQLLQAEEPPPHQSLPSDVEEHQEEWQDLLRQHGLKDPAKAVRLVQTFVHGPGYVHLSSRTMELALQLIPKFLDLCPGQLPAESNERIQQPVLSDPDRVLVRLDNFISAYGARSMLYEMWTNNPSLFNLLLRLFDRSEFLAELAIRVPDLVDDLELSGHLRRQKDAEEILRDLQHGREDKDQLMWLRRYHQTEFMRIGLRDILGLSDFEQNLSELSALADACLQYALEIVLRRNQFQTPPFAVIGLGKLGGAELNYGSDLDLIFVADNRARSLPRYQRLALEMMNLLSSQTELGVAFETDARLRPDGDKGLLVNTLKAYEDYYRHRAQLWELQSLTRVRPIAGNPKVGKRFQTLAAELTNFSRPSTPLAAYRSDWKQEIARMRQRIEKERTPPGKNHLAIKTGTGGLIDAEFTAQALCLAHGWQEPNTLRALNRAEREQALPPEDAKQLIQSYQQLRQIEAILRRWSFEGEILLPDDPAPLQRVAIRCGFARHEDLMTRVEEHRSQLRKIYSQVMEQTPVR